MPRGVFAWLKRRRTAASIAAIAVVLGVPAGFAATHRGVPVVDARLTGLDVWVTNGSRLLGGRLNHQIDQLDASVQAASKSLDVLQDGAGDDVFLVDAPSGSVQRIDPAYVTTGDQITVPAGSWVGYGKDTLAVLSTDGKLWVLPATGTLAFDPGRKPTAVLGAGAVAAVAKSGEVFAASPGRGELVGVARPGAAAVTWKTPIAADAQVSAVGGTAVVLDHGGARLRAFASAARGAGGAADAVQLALPAAALRLQQPSAASDVVLAASASALYRVPLRGGAAQTLPAGGPAVASTTSADVPAPVQLAGCDYAAWAAARRYLEVCGAAAPTTIDIPQATTGAQLAFRVNHGVIALNDLRTGDSWAASAALKLVDNWAQVVPANAEAKTGAKGPTKVVHRSYQESAANRSAANTKPVAKPDSFGVRAGRATVLPVLDNDEDVDGDVLTIAKVDPPQPAASQGHLDVIDGGRALQFTPAPSLAGGFAFHYTVSDGRGGESTTDVHVNAVAPSTDTAPDQIRESGTQVEQGGTIAYNVLQDWSDPDGDGLFLAGASATGADTVSFTPDGDVSFTAKSSGTGDRTVAVTVSDGTKTTPGELVVTVKPRGSLAAVAVPDFATVTLGTPLTIAPLDNDESPSGARLYLAGADAKGAPLQLSPDSASGRLRITASQTGSYYATYQLGAGQAKPVPGIIRIDVVAPPASASPPLAVADTAYVHPGQATTVAPLDNDVSPSGAVLAVQSVTGGADAAALNIQLLDNTVVRITSPGVLQHQVQLTYTVSDGAASAQGSITVVPVSAIVVYQPPIAVADAVTVRAGDIATVDVLANDYSPDDQPFTLDPLLAAGKVAGGSAFVSGGKVRFLAPRKAGTYRVTYQVTDEHQQHARADVVFTVVAAGKSDRAPEPQTLTARAFAGSTVPITVPLDGIDPDGDSVFFDRVDGSPQLGEVTGESATGFVYRAADSASGTDEFSYLVEDTSGRQASALVRIAVVPRPALLQQPAPVDDKVQLKPGTTAAVPVLANDSDPNGYPLALEPTFDQVSPGITGLEADGASVLFTAPKQPGGYRFHYTVSNGHGGRAGAYVQIVVRADAPPRYPSAVDHYVPAQSLHGGDPVPVDALAGAANPSGPVDDLAVSLPGVDAKIATAAGGTVTVRPQPVRSIVQYVVTDPATGLSGAAFIVVPPAPVGAENTSAPPQQGPLRTLAPSTPPSAGATPSSTPTDIPKPGTTPKPTETPGSTPKGSAKPTSKPTSTPTPTTSTAPKGTEPPSISVGTQNVPMNGTKRFVLAKTVSVPSKRSASISGQPQASHGTVTSDGSSFTFTAAQGYRGDASVTFVVDDGREPGQSKDRLTTLSLAITVGSADQSDIPPTFTPPHPQLDPGAGTTIDLRQSSDHPNPKILAALTYSGLTPASANGVTAKLSGSNLTLTAPVTVKSGTSAVFHVTITSPSGEKISGEIDALVQNTKPLAQQLISPQKLSITRGTAGTRSGAVDTSQWSNPYPGTPLRITGASVVSNPGGVTVAFTADSITVTAPSGAGIGTATISYTVMDASNDSSRAVTGQLQATVHAPPAQPQPPADVTCGDGSATFTLAAPASNGSAITGYTVQDGQGHSWSSSTATTMTVNGLSNGTSYSFEARASNQLDGAGAWSAASASCTPYGTPSPVQNLALSVAVYPSYSLVASWTPPADTGGGSVDYHVTITPPSGGIGGDFMQSPTSYQFTYGYGQPAGTYSVTVSAVNGGSGASSSTTTVYASAAYPQPAVHYFIGSRDYYNPSASGLVPGGAYTFYYWCGGDQILNGNDKGRHDNRTADASGNIPQFNTGDDGTGASCDKDANHVELWDASGKIASENAQDHQPALR